MVAGVELTYNTGASATQMANTIFGDGVTVVGASYTGDNRSSAIFSDGDTISPDVTPSDTGVILSTGFADRFTSTNSNQSNLSSGTSINSGGVNNNPDFNAVAGRSTFDAAYLDVSFTSEGDTLTMQFVFASDEYPEYTNSIYNDIVAVWINGAFVPMAVGTGDTSVSNINEQNTLNLYNDNTGDQFNTEMDGFTVTLSLTIPVIPTTDPTNPQVNSIRIGIADASDSAYDSNVLIAAGSLQSVLIAEDDDLSIGINTTKTFNVLDNDSPGGGGVEITHINGERVFPNDTIILPTGQTIKLLPDFTFEITSTGQDSDVVFTYKIEDDDGLTDTAFVSLDTIPCFVAGTLILTPQGEKRIEELRVGDLVLTHDSGTQPIRWIGARTMRAEGKFAPVLIEPGALGDHRRLLVSPQHRVLIRDTLSELFFGEPEVLVSAKHLINGRTIRPMEGGFVTYIHMLFDAHEVVFSEGLATESFLPGPQTNDCFEAAVLDEICEIFPELDPNTGAGYSPAARRTLRAYEAQVLMDGVAA
ncbi:MAG: Hint domain-containing protein [Pseudomonadota bacterium]